MAEYVKMGAARCDRCGEGIMTYLRRIDPNWRVVKCTECGYERLDTHHATPIPPPFGYATDAQET